MTDLASGIETVLLVENEPSFRRLLEHALRGVGYNVITAGTGTAALRVATRCPFPIHLLLTTVVMPVMDGVELSRHMASSHPETRVLFLADHEDQPDVSQHLGDTPRPILLKPFPPETLRQKIRSVLAVAAPRIFAALPVVYRPAGASEWQRGVTVNISQTGMLLETAQPVALGTSLESTFEVQAKLGRFNPGPVTYLGRVVWYAEATQSVPCSIGIQLRGSAAQSGSRSITPRHPFLHIVTSRGVPASIS